jgi:hypothetical protein
MEPGVAGIDRADRFSHGPFSAAYPGNSIGGVLLITSKMPDRPFAIAKETVSVMPWNQYSTKDTYVSSQTSAAAGDRKGALSWLLSANFQDTYQQPLTYTTNGTIPGGTTGAFPALNKQGLPANVVGTGALALLPANLGEPQTCLRPYTTGTGDILAGNLEQRPDVEPTDLSEVDGDGRADIRGPGRIREQ